jgi:quinol monooxygenase YgiN
MAIDVIVRLKTKPGTTQAMLEGLQGILPDTRAFHGCRRVDVVRDSDDLETVFLLEEWEERANHEAYMAWRAERGDLDGLAEVLVEPPTFTYVEKVPGV